MNNMKIGFITILLSLAAQTAWGQFCLHSETPDIVNCNRSEAPVVHTALELLQRDYRAVFSDTLQCKETQGNILVGTLGVNHKVEQSRVTTSLGSRSMAI